MNRAARRAAWLAASLSAAAAGILLAAPRALPEEGPGVGKGAGVPAYPSDPAEIVRAVKEGRLPPLAPWPRFRGTVPVPPFGAEPPVDALNAVPAGKEAWSRPAEGGTLVVQYNSAPKVLNHIIDNSAVITYVNELTNAYLIHQHKVKFSYGVPSKEDPQHVFESENPHDLALRYVKEDTLLRAATGGGGKAIGTALAYGAVTDTGDAWEVRPIAVQAVEGETRKPETFPKRPGDRVLRGTFVTVFLRPGVKWHDGAPFRAQDVEFSVKVIQNPLVNSDNLKTYFEMVKECRALNDTTLRWVLDRQYFGADDTTVGGNLEVVPLHAYRAAFEKEKPGVPFDPSGQAFAQFFNNHTPLNERPLGTGPYRVAEFNQSRSVVLERNPHYFGPRTPADRIVWKWINDPVAALQALQSGEIDFAAHGLTAELYTSVMAEPRFQDRFARAYWFTPSFSFVSWNVTVDCLKDPNVRAALGLLADRPSYVEKKLHGVSVLTSGDNFLAGPAFDREVLPMAFDPKAAEEILDEAGWYDRDGDEIRDKDGKKLEFNLLIPSGSKTMKEFVPVWLEALKKAGVSMKVSELDWAAFVDRFDTKKFDAIALSYAMDPESDPHQLWHSSWTAPDKRQPNTFADPRADALIDAIRPCLDREERWRYQKALHRILDAEQPFLFLWATPEIAGWSRRWRGVKLYPRRPGFDLMEWYVPRELQEGR